MSVTSITSNLHQLVIPTPFPVGPVNVYLARGAAEPLTLIDTGPRTDEARTALEQSLAALGYALSDVEPPQLLLDSGADPNLKSDTGRIPLEIASFCCGSNFI